MRIDTFQVTIVFKLSRNLFIKFQRINSEIARGSLIMRKRRPVLKMEMYLVVFGFDMGPNVKFVSAFMDV